MKAKFTVVALSTTVTFLALLLVGFNYYRLELKNLRFIESEHELSQSRERLEKVLLHVESTTRAFLLTRDREFLQLRESRAGDLRRHLDTYIQQSLRLSIPDRSQELRKLVNERLQLTKQVIDEDQSQRETIRETVKRGTEITSRIESELAKQEKEQNDQISKHKNVLLKSLHDTELALYLVGIWAVFSFLLALFVGKNYFEEKEKLERRFRAIFDQTLEFIGFLTPEGILLEANETACKFAGVKPQEVIGKAFWETPWWTHSQEAVDGIKNAIRRCRNGELVRLEFEHFAPSGKAITVDFSLKPVYDQGGKLVFLLPEGRDISDRIAAEKRTQEREQQFQSIISTLAEGIYQVDVNGRLVLMNRAAEEILLYSESELKGKIMHDVIHSESPDGRISRQSDCPLMKVIEKNEVVRLKDEWFKKKNGTFVPVECVSAPLLRDGAVAGAVVAFQDISIRKENEARVSEFYSTVSHELRTPITAIRGSLGLLEGGHGGNLDETGIELVEMSRTECDRLVRLLNEILDIRKIEAGKMELNLQVLAPEDIINNAISILERSAEEKDLLISKELKVSADAKLLADPDRLTQILVNLLANAIKFAPDKSEIKILLESREQSLYFAVADKGPGIKPEDQSRLFKQFQQLKSSDSQKGTGLGLAIAKALVDLHEGRIGVDNQTGGGTVFWFELPKRSIPELNSVPTKVGANGDGSADPARPEAHLQAD